MCLKKSDVSFKNLQAVAKFTLLQGQAAKDRVWTRPIPLRWERPTLHGLHKQCYARCMRSLYSKVLMNELCPLAYRTRAVGHCHPRVVEAFSTQAATLGCSPFPNYDLLKSYSKHLLSHFPDKLNHVFYTSSGWAASSLCAFHILPYNYYTLGIW